MMSRHDYINARDQWPDKREIQTEEELNKQFKRSKFKSHQAFLAWKVGSRDCLESRFLEWMETTPTKYDEDGNVYYKRSGEPGLIYRWLLSTSGPKFNTIMLILLWLGFGSLLL